MATKSVRYSLIAAVVLLLSTASAYAQCTLGGTLSTWNISGNGNWSTSGDWNPAGAPNSTGTNVCITNGASTVTLDISPNIASLQVGSGNTLAIADNTALKVNGSSIINNGSITLNSAGKATSLVINSSGTVTLSGTGTVTLGNNTNNQINGPNAGTLLNQQTIQGAGQMNVNLNNQGTVNANVSQSLTVNAFNGVTNTGTLEATNGGTLVLTGDSQYNNAGGTILANGPGSAVNLTGALVTGGTLTTLNGGTIAVTNSFNGLDNVTISSGSLVSMQFASNMTLQDTITNKGTIAMNSSSIYLFGDVTLTGGGTVLMSNDAGNLINGTSSLKNLDNTIQGAGTLNVGTLVNSGSINGNVGNSLTIEAFNGVTNTGTLEATNGGTLVLTGDSQYNNAGGTILANGPGSAVNLTGALVTGGTLTTLNGGTIAVTNSFNGLDNVTISSGSLVSMQFASNMTLQDTITNKGTIAMNSSSIYLFGDVTLTGGGTVLMSNDAGNLINGTSSLKNLDNTIQGAGTLNVGTLVNSGSINGNVGNSLTIEAFNGVTNTGTLEATNGGTLVLTGDSQYNNAGGTILANGPGSAVNLTGALVTGGTLTTLNGGMIAVTNSFNGLDNVTISSGSLVSMQFASNMTLQDTITNKGTIAMNSSSIYLFGDVTLTGGGTLLMSNDAGNLISGFNSTLNNVDNTIRGAGTFQGTGLAIINGGTFLADQSSPLTINSTTFTNNGTLQVNSGSQMHVEGTFNNFSGGTLAGGSYILNGGTMQVDAFGSTGGELTTLGDGVHSTVLTLNGTNATTQLLDSAGKNALNLSAVTANASLNLTNGYQMSNSSAFTNAGNVLIDGTSSLSVASYDQTAGQTVIQAGGTLDANTVTISGGAMTVDGTLDPASIEILTALDGTGNIIGNVTNDGTVEPGDSGTPGTLTITGNYTQHSTGILLEDILGTSSYSVLDVSGDVNLDGTIKVNLLGGFTPGDGETFAFLTGFSSFSGSLTISGVPDPQDWSIFQSGDSLDLRFGQAGGAVPEPRFVILEAAVLACVAFAWRRRRKEASNRPS